MGITWTDSRVGDVIKKYTNYEFMWCTICDTELSYTMICYWWLVASYLLNIINNIE